MATVAAYIDGFNLYYGMKTKFAHRYLWLDVVRLVQHLRPDDEIVAVRYCTALVKAEPDAAARQNRYVEALRAHTAARCSTYRSAGSNPASSHPASSAVSTGCADPPAGALLRGEGDRRCVGRRDGRRRRHRPGGPAPADQRPFRLRPAIKAVKRVRPEQQVIMAMPPGNVKPHKRFADLGSFSMNETALRRSQLPQTDRV